MIPVPLEYLAARKPKSYACLGTSCDDCFKFYGDARSHMQNCPRIDLNATSLNSHDSFLKAKRLIDAYREEHNIEDPNSRGASTQDALNEDDDIQQEESMVGPVTRSRAKRVAAKRTTTKKARRKNAVKKNPRNQASTADTNHKMILRGQRGADGVCQEPGQEKKTPFLPPDGARRNEKATAALPYSSPTIKQPNQKEETTKKVFPNLDAEQRDYRTPLSVKPPKKDSVKLANATVDSPIHAPKIESSTLPSSVSMLLEHRPPDAAHLKPFARNVTPSESPSSDIQERKGKARLDLPYLSPIMERSDLAPKPPPLLLSEGLYSVEDKEIDNLLEDNDTKFPNFSEESESPLLCGLDVEKFDECPLLGNILEVQDGGVFGNPDETQEATLKSNHGAKATTGAHVVLDDISEPVDFFHADACTPNIWLPEAIIEPLPRYHEPSSDTED